MISNFHSLEKKIDNTTQWRISWAISELHSMSMINGLNNDQGTIVVDPMLFGLEENESWRYDDSQKIGAYILNSRNYFTMNRKSVAIVTLDSPLEQTSDAALEKFSKDQRLRLDILKAAKHIALGGIDYAIYKVLVR